jgi:hypothetical protein
VRCAQAGLAWGECQMEGGVMMRNKDASDVRGLEEVFRSHEFGRATDATGDGAISLPGDLEDESTTVRGIRRPLSSVHVYEAGDESEPRPSAGGESARLGGTVAPEQLLLDASSDGGRVGKGPAEAPAASGWNRHSTRYWTLACLSALAALVAAGVTAGSNPQRPSLAAQGAHGGSHAQTGHGGKYHTSRPATSGPTAASGTLASSGSSGAAGAAGGGAHGTGNVPGGHVSLIGASTFTGAPGGSASGGGGKASSPPPAAAGNPVAPVAATVTSTVSGAGTAVTTAASQVGSSVPAAASTAAVVGSTVTAVDQAVSASTL